MSDKVNQRKAVLNYLKSGKSLTSKEAFELFGVTRLSAIIFDFRNRGYIIHTLMCEGTTRYGDTCKYAKYILVNEEGTNE